MINKIKNFLQDFRGSYVPPCNQVKFPKATNKCCIPVDPPDGLLKSMALRYNHAFGLSNGMSDEEILETRKIFPISGKQYLTSTEKSAILSTMRQLHEEVVGKGFYKYDY